MLAFVEGAHFKMEQKYFHNKKISIYEVASMPTIIREFSEMKTPRIVMM